MDQWGGALSKIRWSKNMRLRPKEPCPRDTGSLGKQKDPPGTPNPDGIWLDIDLSPTP